MTNMEQRFTKFMEECTRVHADVDVTNWTSKEELEGLLDHEDFIYDLFSRGWKEAFALFKEENKLNNEELEEFEELKHDEEFLRKLENRLERQYNEIVEDYIEKKFSDDDEDDED